MPELSQPQEEIQPCKGKIAELVKQAKHDPVIVMFDDRGLQKRVRGKGLEN